MTSNGEMTPGIELILEVLTNINTRLSNLEPGGSGQDGWHQCRDTLQQLQQVLPTPAVPEALPAPATVDIQGTLSQVLDVLTDINIRLSSLESDDEGWDDGNRCRDMMSVLSQILRPEESGKEGARSE